MTKIGECTTIIVGNKQTADGSIVLARSEDLELRNVINLESFAPTDNGPTEFVARQGGFHCTLPSKALGYTAMPGTGQSGEWGAAGFNSAGVGMSSTESIFASARAEELDPLVPNGLAENSTYNIVLPYIHSAREGVERLGKLIEEYGCAEGFGIGFIDNKEVWYLESCAGHRYLACKIPADVYFVTANQSRFREYDPTDKDNFIASADLIDFAIDNGLYDPASGPFDFHKAYQRDVLLDTTYNYPRVFELQKLFSPQIKNDIHANTFPVYATPAEPITLSTLRRAYRFHYDNTEHDPYLHQNPKEPYRPISIYRTTQTHILVVRPWLPKEIGEITYMALGMADLSVFVPLYQGVTSYPKAYTQGDERSSNDSAYWKMRHVQALGMTDYNRYAPIIKERWLALEHEMDEKQACFEKQYLAICQQNAEQAHALLQRFSDEILNQALDMADDLTEELFTLLNYDIEKEYLFHGA